MNQEQETRINNFQESTDINNNSNNLIENKKIDILLMTPPCIELYEGLRDVAPISPPLGLLYIASVLEKNNINLNLLDTYAENLNWGQVEAKIKHYNPTILGLTCVTSTFNEVVKIVEIAKKNNPQIVTIVGGPHVTAIPKKILEKYSNIDIIVVGEGDYTLLEIHTELKNKKNFKNVKGIAYRNENKIIVNERRELISDLDLLPFPARHLIKNNLYKPSKDMSAKDSFFTVLTSRGCPNRCTFCSSKIMFGTMTRFRSPENVIDEIRQTLKFFNTKQIVFMDDTFTLVKDRVLKICELLKEFDLEWGCLARVNTVDEEMLKKMKESGCNWIGYGVESGSADILIKIKKGITIEQVKKAVSITKKVGIPCTAFFILGHLDETPESVEETIKLAKEIDADFAQFNVLTPYPGTEVYERAIKESLITRDFEDYGNPKYKDPVISLKTMDNKTLKKYWKKATYSYYLRPKVMLRLAKKAILHKDERKRLFHLIGTFIRFNT